MTLCLHQGGKNQKQDPAYGADVLRLWVASVDYNSDVLIGGRILSQVICCPCQHFCKNCWCINTQRQQLSM